ncbi:MAG: hypothetical protein A4E57_04090 [Syntrophorhabdaceae bacterium PtaU1.Bin034]|nr:MAG: hypothetical protein A4E57_04090 [Syntrophorhabdaceae bacterium PtaU1.Bin034]
MHPEKGLARVCSPVAEQALLDVFDLQGFAQKGIVFEVKHADAEVKRRPPVSIDLL